MNTAQGVLAETTVIVTGAGQGIGATLAEYLSGEGASVVVCDVNGALVEQTAETIRSGGGRAVAVRADVTSWDDCTKLVRTAVDTFGGLHGIVNNAGVNHQGTPFSELDADSARRVFEVNILGTYTAGIVAMQHMIENGGGSVVNVTSGVQAGMGSGASYSASKGAIASLTYSWAVDCIGTGIRVNAISPVGTTPMTRQAEAADRARNADAPARPVVDVLHNCPAIAYLLSDLSSDINGQVLRTHERTLQLISHPVVMHPEVERESWTPGDVAGVVAEQFSDHLPPLGLHAARMEYVPLSKVNVVAGLTKMHDQTARRDS